MSRTITVYSSPTCAYCETLKAHLRKLGVPFNEIDVTQENIPGILALPTTDVFENGTMKRITGYSPKKVKEIVG